jgi:hypothetical protein
VVEEEEEEVRVLIAAPTEVAASQRLLGLPDKALRDHRGLGLL